MAIEILMLEVGWLRLGIRSSEVSEVLRAVALAPLPNSPAMMEGVLNLRGQIMGVLDIRAILQLPPKPIEPMDHLIVLQAGDRRVAIRADRAVELALVDDCDMAPTEGTVAATQYTGAIAKTAAGLVHVVEPQTLLSSSAAAWLAQTLAAATPTEAAP